MNWHLMTTVRMVRIKNPKKPQTVYLFYLCRSKMLNYRIYFVMWHIEMFSTAFINLCYISNIHSYSVIY